MSKHNHRSAETRTVGWTHCVVGGSCSGASHGGVTFVDTCRCGAKRYTESNGSHRGRSEWAVPETEQSAE